MESEPEKDRVALFPAQESLLRAFGFLDFHHRCAKINATFHVLAALLLLGGCFSLALFTASVMWQLTIESGHSFVVLLTRVPYCFTSSRGILVLFLMFLNRKMWSPTKHEAKSLIASNFLLLAEHDTLVKRLQKVGVILCILTFLMHVSWEILDWLRYQDVDPVRYNFSYDGAVDPVPLKYTVWQYLITWSLFSDLPFFLSQQVYITLAIYGFILYSCLKRLNLALIEEREALNACNEEQSPRVCSMACKISVVLSGKMEHLRRRYVGVMLFCYNLSRDFGPIAVVIYGMDLLTICGFMSALVIGKNQFLTAHLLNCSTLLFFGCYILMLIPFAAAYTQSHCLNLNIHRLMDSAHFLFHTKEGNQLRIILNSFAVVNRDQQVTFSGAGLFQVSRSFLAGTFTFVVSSAILMHEVVLRTDQHSKCNSWQNTTISID